VNTSNTDPFSSDVVFAEGNASIGMNLGTSYGDNSRLWFDYGSTTSTNWVRSNVNQVVSGTTVCAVVRMLTKSYDLYINGTFVSGVVRSFNPTAVAGSFRIGNEIFPANGSAAKIDLCEFVIYSGTLSVSEISQLSTYFTDKWGIV
jgi:hypothetical protein